MLTFDFNYSETITCWGVENLGCFAVNLLIAFE